MIQKTALITGASAGIGQSFARVLAASGEYNLVLTARREERLRALQHEVEEIWRVRWPGRGLCAEVIVSDLASVASRAELLTAVGELGFELDLVINNAGFGSYGPFAERDVRRELEMIAVNVEAPVQLAHFFARRMAARGQGAIVNVCSTCSFQPLPSMATYAATKAFLYSFSAALAEELRGAGVQVLALCPGPTESEFHLAAGLNEKIALLPSMPADAVVREALRAVGGRRRLVVTGWRNKLLALASWLVPPSLSTRLVHAVLR